MPKAAQLPDEDPIVPEPDTQVVPDVAPEITEAPPAEAQARTGLNHPSDARTIAFDSPQFAKVFKDWLNDGQPRLIGVGSSSYMYVRDDDEHYFVLYGEQAGLSAFYDRSSLAGIH